MTTKRMAHSVCFFRLIILLKILQAFECNNLETETLSMQSPNSDLRNDNETVYNTSKNNSTFISSTKRPASLEDSVSVSEKCCKEAFTMTESFTMDTTESKDKEENQQIITILKESIHNSVLEPWYRVKRDSEDEEYQEASNSDESSQDNSSDSDQGLAVDESQNNDYETTEEGTEDASNQNSNEESSSLSDPAQIDSANVKNIEKRNTYSEESTEEGRLYPPWYQSTFGNRFWSSGERDSSHHFIRVPVFPGK